MGLDAHRGFTSGHRVLITVRPKDRALLQELDALPAPGFGGVNPSSLWVCSIHRNWQRHSQLLWHRTTHPEFTADTDYRGEGVSRFTVDLRCSSHRPSWDLVLSWASSTGGSIRERVRLLVTWEEPGVEPLLLHFEKSRWAVGITP